MHLSLNCREWLADANKWRNKKMKNLVLAVIVAVLVVVAVVQAVQLNGLKEKVQSGVALKPSSAAPSSTGGNAPSSLQNLPQMVGGC